MICSLRSKTSRKGVAAAYTGEEKVSQDIPPEFETNIESGFQIATFQGPLCAEPMEGLAYFVEDIEFDAELLDDQTSGHMFRIKQTWALSYNRYCVHRDFENGTSRRLHDNRI